MGQISGYFTGALKILFLYVYYIYNIYVQYISIYTIICQDVIVHAMYQKPCSTRAEEIQLAFAAHLLLRWRVKGRGRSNWRSFSHAPMHGMLELFRSEIVLT